MPGYYHAASTTLHPFDRVQDRLCRELGLLPAEALVTYELAPLNSRRDMALLGLLHRIVLKDAPPQLAELFPPARAWPFGLASTRPQVRRHNKRLHQRAIGTETLRRSLFGLVKVYNLLPQQIINKTSVKLFQSALQQALCVAASLNVHNWEYLLFLDCDHCVI